MQEFSWLVPLLLVTSLLFDRPVDDGGDGSSEEPVASKAERVDAIGLAPPIGGAELERRAAEAYRRGLDFLLSRQNEDGSWGSHVPWAANFRDFGFGTTSRGANDGVRTACTAIIATALLEHPRPAPKSVTAVDASLDRAISELLKTDKIAYSHGECFNTWGYGFKLAFLCDLFEDPRGAELHEEIRAAASVCIRGLARFQQADGGWNYYASPMGNGESMSFNTANFAAALAHAASLDFEVPDGMIDDAFAVLRRMRTIKGSLLYDARFIAPSMRSARVVNDLSSASRTAAVTEAFAVADRLHPGEMERALEIFDEGENWLEDGRKHIQPHAGVHQIAGYFFFYGYRYHTLLLQRLGDEVARERWDRNAWTMIRTQEEDGGWWDTPAADYGDKWGTGFALLVLQDYLEQVGALDLITETIEIPESEGNER
jgi:hypothetical protein